MQTVDPRLAWTDTDYLLAMIAELQDEGNRIAYSAATGGKRKLRPKPVTVPRPTGPAEQKRLKVATPEQIEAFFGGAKRATG